MAKKIEMTRDESILFNELNKLAKRANHRLLRIERLTGKKETFASKQLYDYLSSSNLNALSKTGRIRVSKKYSMNQMRAVIKATKQYLASPTSTIKGIKQYKQKVSDQAGMEIDFEKADVLFQARSNYTWIYEYMTPSEFWAFVRVAKEYGWNKETFVNELLNYIDEIPDELLKNRIRDLYDYVMGE